MTDLDNLKAELKMLRDELNLRMHLASMEARSEWRELEGKWSHFSAKAGLADSAEGIGGALGNLGKELKASYKRLLGALKD